MENINKIDPYEAIISMKWAPETGQIEMNPIPAGTEVSVIQKGVFVTDNQGALLIRNKEDTQIFSNLLNHVWELWIIPEIIRRKDAKIPAPIPFNKFIILFGAEKENVPTIKFNDEYEFKGLFIIKRGSKFNKGDPIHFDQIVDIGTIEPPTKNGKPVAFFLFRLDGRQISVYFDFRPDNPKFELDEWKEEGKWLADAYLETILAKYFGHLALVIPRLSKNDIPFTIGLKAEKMKSLCAIIEKGIQIEELDSILSNSISSSDVEPLIDNWLTLDLFSKRENLLKDVLKSLKNDIYGVVISLLMSHVEGIITDELVLHNKGLKKNGEAKYWSIRIKEFDEIVRAEKIGPLTTRILNGTIYFLKESNLYKGMTWTTGDSRIN